MLACSFDSGGIASGDASVGAPTGTAAEVQTTPGLAASGGDSTTAGSVGLTSTIASSSSSGGPSADATTSAGTSPQDTTSASGSTAGPIALVDDGLLGRYYLDEAAIGTAPTEVVDHAPDPLPLPISYAGDQMAYDEVGRNRGLRWRQAELDAGAGRRVVGTKLEQIDGAPQATIEVVVDVEAVTNHGSRFCHFGRGEAGGDFSMRAEEMDRVRVWVNDRESEVWPTDLGVGRRVLTAVYDPALADPSDQLRLYVDGSEVVPESESPQHLGRAIALRDQAVLALGNRPAGARSFAGVLYYAAVYTHALTPEQVANNAELLLVSDDAS